VKIKEETVPSGGLTMIDFAVTRRQEFWLWTLRLSAAVLMSSSRTKATVREEPSSYVQTAFGSLCGSFDSFGGSAVFDSIVACPGLGWQLVLTEALLRPELPMEPAGKRRHRSALT
jgi:hypothetical protein